MGVGGWWTHRSVGTNRKIQWGLHFWLFWRMSRVDRFGSRGGSSGKARSMASRGKRPFDGSAFVSLRWSKSQRRDAEGPAGTPLNADLSQLDSRALPFSATTQPEFTVSPPSRGVSTPCVAKPCSGSLQLHFKLGLYRCVRVRTAARVFWRGGWWRGATAVATAYVFSKCP